MKQLLRVLPLVVVLVGFALPMAADSPPETVRTTFQVKGMHCGGCSSAIISTLEKIDGVVEVDADHEAGWATATYATRKVDAEDLKQEIEKLGYTVTAMETEVAES